MVPVVYQAYPGGPQQIYYVPAHGMHAQTGGGLLEGIREKIRDLASTDKLEGFSLSQTFSQAFSHHGADAIEEYMMVGSARTTPPLESVETGWPRPWMFFRLLLIFAIISVACYFDWKFAQDPTMISALLIMGAFAVPVSTLVLIFEMNTPRNVSMVVVGNLFVIGGLFGLGAVAFEYMIPIAGKIPGIVEETAKFAAVLLVMRSLRYKYQLNGILFGAAVGAGFAAFETAFYGLSMSFLPAFVQALIQSNGQELTAYNVGMQAMASNLLMRGVLAPFGHVAWTAIAAGAFWRVKQDKPATLAMLTDTRFLKAFLIPVALHSLWDIGLDFPNSALINSTLFQISDYVLNGLTSWFVLFGLIQQGLHQVRNEQKSQLQSTLVHVEATLGLGARNYAMQPQSQAGD
jgi:RsiW-degrading membrane proteinase PrsW (M82 family)